MDDAVPDGAARADGADDTVTPEQLDTDTETDPDTRVPTSPTPPTPPPAPVLSAASVTPPSPSPAPAGATTAVDPEPAAGSRLCLLLAALLAGAGVIHLVMAPVHAAGSTVEAAGFAFAGWLQLGLAALLLLRPSRELLSLTAVASALFIVAWAVSRTVGLPVGPEAGVAEAVGTVDLTTVVLEAAAAVLAVVGLARPRLLDRLPAGLAALGTAVPAAVLVVVTLVVVSPSTAQHSHDEVPEAAAAPGGMTPTQAAFDASRCDKSLNPKAYWKEAAAAGVDTVSTSMPASSAATGESAGHEHGHAAPSPAAPRATATDPLQGRGSAKLDKVVSLLGSESEADAARVVVALSDFDDTEYAAFLYQLRAHASGHSAHATTGDDTGGHGGHLGPIPWVAMTDQAQCDKLRQELDLARETALRYPTAADAEAGGWKKITPYVPGIGAHYMNFDLVDGTFDITKPEMLLYDGEGPEAHVVGLSYFIRQKGDGEPTQGFTGASDHFHRHIGLCIKDTMVIGDSTTTPEQCAAQGGTKSGGAGGWMNHVWVVPGCESPWGVFSGASPVLDKQLGERSGSDGGGCQGSKARGRYDLTPGDAATVATANDGTETASGG